MVSYEKANEIIEELFESRPSRYRIGLETSMNCSDLSLIVFICCIPNIRKIQVVVDHS